MARIVDGIPKNIIGEKIREFRKERCMSQQELSDKLETFAVYVCRGSISRIEDKTRTVSDIELLGFSKVFDVTIDSFFN